MRNRHLTLHVRLTKSCNADCTYCSSWQGNHQPYMSVSDYSSALIYIRDHIVPIMGCGGPASTISLQYVGGEILLVPKNVLRECVYAARSIMGEAFGNVIDGVQSNLVGSERRIMELDTLFAGRVGTSVDGRGIQRTIKGSPEAYRRIVAKSVEAIYKRRKQRPGAVFVVDAEGASNAVHEVETANELNHPLVLRAIFQGGSKIEKGGLADTVEAFEAAFDAWAMKTSIAVEPFAHLLKKRLGSHNVVGSVCPFQRDCAENSLNLEPDGSLFTCFEMADSGHFCMGNAIQQSFSIDVWNSLRQRTTNIDPKCQSCPWFNECQGGCMNEAIHDTGSPYGRPDLCAVWTALFKRIDALIADKGKEAVQTWLAKCNQI
jgi:radical SAM protein with 4Fe4S-binding SPASM domain